MGLPYNYGMQPQSFYSNYGVPQYQYGQSPDFWSTAPVMGNPNYFLSSNYASGAPYQGGYYSPTQPTGAKKMGGNPGAQGGQILGGDTFPGLQPSGNQQVSTNVPTPTQPQGPGARGIARGMTPPTPVARGAAGGPTNDPNYSAWQAWRSANPGAQGANNFWGWKQQSGLNTPETGLIFGSTSPADTTTPPPPTPPPTTPPPTTPPPVTPPPPTVVNPNPVRTPRPPTPGYAYPTGTYNPANQQ